MRSLRALAANPITEWAAALLNLAVALVAFLTLLAKLPILPPDVLTIIASIVVALNAIIAWLKLLIPSQ